MRRYLMTVVAFALALACVAERATAQEKKPDAEKAPKPAARPLQMAPIRTTTAPVAAVPAPGWRGLPTRPYSYFAAVPPYPARYYWGYGGGQDFPFFGRVYGRPFDLWTWPYMNSNPLAAVSNYYYPPLGF